MNAPMHCLVLSDTFPNRLQPWRGPYNRRQIECLATHCAVTVIDPLPWPQLLAGPKRWALTSGVDTVLDGIAIHHPIFWYLPVLGRGLMWRGLCRAAGRAMDMGAKGPFDLILATFAYPHGMAAKRLAERLNVPYVIKVRGTDLHGLPPGGARRALTAEAVRGAAGIVAVSRNLADIAAQLGAEPEKIALLPNGIDTDAFPAMERNEARQRLQQAPERRIILFVGNLLPVKGLDILLEAVERMTTRMGPGAFPLVALAGEGPLRGWLERRVAERRLGDRVRLLGHVGRKEVALWMNAADVVVLPSRNEGCPNVVLEGLCCGTPVVASRVGAVPDMLDSSCGVIVQPEAPQELADGLCKALAAPWDRDILRRRVAGMSWQANAHELHGILSRVATSRK